MSGRFLVRLWQMVTVALALLSSAATGMPTILLRPTTTALAPSIWTPERVEQFDAAGRRARHKERIPPFHHQAADIDRAEAIHILVQVDQVPGAFFVQLFGQRQLDQDAVYGGISI